MVMVIGCRDGIFMGLKNCRLGGCKVGRMEHLCTVVVESTTQHDILLRFGESVEVW